MIAQKMRNRIANLRDARAAGLLDDRVLELALAGFEADADAVARIEAAPIPQARRSCAAANVIDFLKPAFERRGGGAV